MPRSSARGAAAVAQPRAEAVRDRGPDDRQRVGDRHARTTRSGDVGVDAKYGITQNLTADLTYNTDFAQVEADEQQVNLTRFSLFFPEKRDFFLENQGIFTFGNNSTGSANGSTLATCRCCSTAAASAWRTGARCRSAAAAASRAAWAATSSGAVNMQTSEDVDGGAPSHELLRGARQARHPAAQQHRHAGHVALEVADPCRGRTRPTEWTAPSRSSAT